MTNVITGTDPPDVLRAILDRIDRAGVARRVWKYDHAAIRDAHATVHLSIRGHVWPSGVSAAEALEWLVEAEKTLRSAADEVYAWLHVPLPNRPTWSSPGEVRIVRAESGSLDVLVDLLQWTGYVLLSDPVQFVITLEFLRQRALGVQYWALPAQRQRQVPQEFSEETALSRASELADIVRAAGSTGRRVKVRWERTTGEVTESFALELE